MTENKKIIGHIGLGHWGKNILRNLIELGVLHTACDVTESVVDGFREQYPEAAFTTSFDEILANPEIKGVSIATPAVTHFECAKRALLAGKDVFVEKPLSLAVEEGEELVALAEKEGRVLMVGHILQYHTAVIMLKHLIDSGELGEIRYIYSNRLNMGKLRTEEDVLWSFAPHDISVILMLMGESPLEVSTVGGSYVTEGLYDTTMTLLRFSAGVKGHIFVSWLNPFKEQKLIVVGSLAMAVFDDICVDKLVIYRHAVEWTGGAVPVAKKADREVVELEKSEPLKEEMRHFLNCMKTRKPPTTDGKEGLNVLRVLTAQG